MRLTPRDTRFYELLAASAANLTGAASLLEEWVAAAPADRKVLAERMRAVEHAGDDAKHAIMHQLNTSFITPFDREDISQLAGNLDDVLDYVEAAVDLSVLYRIEELPDGVGDQVRLLSQAAKLTADAMPRLRTLRDLESYWITINGLENEADQVYRNLLARLFDGRFDALTVMKIKEVVDQLEYAADGFEHVANTIQTIAAKES